VWVCFSELLVLLFLLRFLTFLLLVFLIVVGSRTGRNMFFRSTQTQAQTDVESVPLNTLPPIPSSNTGIVEGVASSTLPPIPSSNTISGTRIGGLAASGRSGTKSQSKTWATTVTEIPSWPEGAKPLKHLDWMSWLFLIGDVILVVLPIYFIRKLLYIYDSN
jgi:hypothetical protein